MEVLCEREPMVPLRNRGDTRDGKLIRIRVAVMLNAPPNGGFLGNGRLAVVVIALVRRQEGQECSRRGRHSSARPASRGGRYRLVQQLGEGGMGQVWEAQDKTLGRPVAVKVISLLAGGGSLGGEARARFLREARITAQLQHPNIVTIHDLGETGAGNERVPFLVMELVRGEGLDVILRRGVAPCRTRPDGARR
ncbi:hypothetical protein GCM10020000_82500 [Streptomyces olivoverticillatus]